MNRPVFSRYIEEMSSSAYPAAIRRSYSPSVDSTTGSTAPWALAMSRQMRRSLSCSRTRKPAGNAPLAMNGARFTKYQLDPAPLPKVSMTRSSGKPSAFAKAIASATAWMMPAHMI